MHTHTQKKNLNCDEPHQAVTSQKWLNKWCSLSPNHLRTNFST